MLRIDCLIQEEQLFVCSNIQKNKLMENLRESFTFFSSFVEHLCKILDLAIESSIGFWMLTLQDWFFDHTSQKQRPGR